MILNPALIPRTESRAAIQAAYLLDETVSVDALLKQAILDPNTAMQIQHRARDLVEAVREKLKLHGGLDAFLHEYNLSSQEGVVLMCLAESLLRIPDSDTADRLIQDKLANAAWASHLGQSPSLLVNAATWGLMLTGKLVRIETGAVEDIGDYIGKLVAASGEPLIRAAIKEAMRILGHQFVMGRTIEEALARSREAGQRDFLYSYDMLGEAALTGYDAEQYLDAYMHAIRQIGQTCPGTQDPGSVPGISVKLSALHPRFEFAQRERVLREMLPRLQALCEAARDAGIGLTIDAEEADSLEITLDVFEAVFTSDVTRDWTGLGLAIQAYQKRAPFVIDWLTDLATTHKRRLMLRLVKGAYWDTEIKHAQEQGLSGYAVFTRKVATDVSYLACVKRVLKNPDLLYPQFATHNAYTVASILTLMPQGSSYEFQRLHGMGLALFNEIKTRYPERRCRVYAPVGSHEDLLPYLVRRLLENGANTSFVNRVEDLKLPVECLIRDPVETLSQLYPRRHPRIPPPADLYGATRRNAMGLNLNDEQALHVLADAMAAHAASPFHAAPLVDGVKGTGTPRPVVSPADTHERVGEVHEGSAEDIQRAFAVAHQAAAQWSHTSAEERAHVLERAADLMESHHTQLMYLCIREAGRCITDSLAEVREAVDFCRYYAAQIRTQFVAQDLPGPTGEKNTLSLFGRGVFACISPWNFPLAIFTGQVVASLAAGNCVIAKPARQTPLVAMRVVELLHEAGVPTGVLHFIPGSSTVLSDALLNHPALAGVAFTGSTDAARTINQVLAHRPGPILPLIAETGGQNVMIVDSSALPEQVVKDTLRSAFNSAGQRCSALRVLYLQEEIAPKVIALMTGAMQELVMGDPAWLATDVGPVIDSEARDKLETHIGHMKKQATLVAQAPLPGEAGRGTYVTPSVFEIASIDQLPGEVFGPVLHIIRYPAKELDNIIAQINSTGYGLTLGIHSRIASNADYICARTRVGNTYINRNMIGAVVGVQPFGGEGLSGTGPKAGGPHTLARFATERTVTNNIAALGGNADLLGMED